MARYNLKNFFSFDNTDIDLDRGDPANYFVQVVKIDETASYQALSDKIIGEIMGAVKGFRFTVNVTSLSKDVIVVTYASYVRNVANVSGKVSDLTVFYGRILSTYLG
jgi:hypothetical protein